MAIKTLTPMQLWADYDCDKDCLAINILSLKADEDVNVLEFAYTAMITDGGITRIRARAEYPKNGAQAAPVLFYLDNDGDTLDFRPYIDAGYAVITCDYTGVGDSVFASDVEYARLGQEGEHLTAKLGADKTALFARSKIIRRLIGAVGSMPMFDGSRVALMGWGEACDIVWQVAAVDKRVGVIVPFLNSGWRNYSGETVLTDDEKLRWDIGCSVQANAKFVDSKILLCVATNNSEYSFDKLGDTLKLLKPSTDCRVLISPQLTDQVYDYTQSVIKYIKAVLIDAAPLIETPTLSCDVQDGKLMVNTRVDGAISEVTDVQLYYSYDNDECPQFRHWYAQSVGSDIHGLGNAAIKTYDADESIHLFIIASYKNGLSVCGSPCKITPSELGKVKTVKRNTRIVYERKLGSSQFVTVTDGKIIGRGGVKLVPGALDILGVTADKGDVLTYRIGEIKSENVESILQLDIYSKELDSCEVVLIDVNKTKYSAVFGIDNHDEWIKAQLQSNDFKSPELVPLKSWGDIKCMIIKNADKLLFNNILWV